MSFKNKIIDLWNLLIEYYKGSNKRCLFIYCIVELMWLLIFYKMGIRYTIGEWKILGLL